MSESLRRISRPGRVIGEDVLNFTLIAGYFRMILKSAKVVRYLKSQHPDVLPDSLLKPLSVGISATLTWSTSFRSVDQRYRLNGMMCKNMILLDLRGNIYFEFLTVYAQPW